MIVLIFRSKMQFFWLFLAVKYDFFMVGYVKWCYNMIAEHDVPFYFFEKLKIFCCIHDNLRTSWAILFKFGQEVFFVNILDVSKVGPNWIGSSVTFGTS